MCEIPKLFCTKGTSKYDNSSSTYSLPASKKRNSNVVGQYIKNGIPFRMRNPADPSQPQVILPFKYLSEMKNAAESSWSFMHFSNQSFLLEYINAPLGSSIAHQVVRGELNKNLGIAHLDRLCCKVTPDVTHERKRERGEERAKMKRTNLLKKDCLGTVTAPMAALIRQSFADSMPKCNGA